MKWKIFAFREHLNGTSQWSATCSTARPWTDYSTSNYSQWNCDSWNCFDEGKFLIKKLLSFVATSLNFHSSNNKLRHKSKAHKFSWKAKRWQNCSMTPRRSYSFLRIISIFSYQILDFYDANKFRINLSSLLLTGASSMRCVKTFQIKPKLRRNLSALSNSFRRN